MRNLIFSHIFEKQCDYKDTHHGIDKIKEVDSGGTEMISKKVFNNMYEIF